jgi:hypothetical protein
VCTRGSNRAPACGPSTSPLGAMDTPEATYFTSLRDSTWWSLRFVVLLLVGVTLVAALTRGAPLQMPTLLALAQGSVAILLFSLFLGLLLFCFGWMGRVTISEAGIEAPEYSGARSFITWEQIRSASRSSLSGWPCTIIKGGQPEKVLYRMVLGETKRKMIQTVSRYAGANNVLRAHLEEHGT